jgi:hypothetical protein
MKKNVKIWVYAGIAVLAFLYFFVTSPTINPIYPEGAFFWCILITAYIVANQLLNVSGLKVNTRGGSFVLDYDRDNQRLFRKWAVVVLIVIWAVYGLVMLISSPLFFYKAYRDQLPEPATTEFSADIQTIDINQIPVVDKDLAVKLADKKLGEKSSLGSQVRLGEPTIQNVDGKLVWVVPLHHSGFFKWITNLEGSAGYIVVSATDTQDVTYVDDYKIKIQPDSYLMDDLLRRIRFGKGAFTGVTDYSFELDNSGKPYWVVTTYYNKRGFALPEANGIILVDAQTGSMQSYDLDEVPDWVDRVQPEDFVIEQINNRGKYVHGIFNFANTDKTQTSEGHAIIYNNGRCYLFTGLTSVGKDESAIGFMMVDMVTKEPTFYQMSGATENAAMKSAQGKVQNYGYTATFPIVLNIENQPTYFMTLKDRDSQLVKMYSFVSVKNYDIVGVGETAQEAQENYIKALSNDSSLMVENENEELESRTLTGTVERINWTVQDGETQYSILLKEETGSIFTASLSLSPQLPLTQTGDQITISYQFAEGKAVQKITEFENSTFSGSAAQE